MPEAITAGGHYATEIRDIPYGLLDPAPWNYKPAAPPEKMVRLKNSIEFDRSSGVLAVRQMPRGRFEVMDGNHRYEVLGPGYLNWDPIRCEDFGKISKARAIIIAHRRNEQWVDPDVTLLSGLLNDEVLKEIPTDRLSTIIPESPKQLDALLGLARFDWVQLPATGKAEHGANYIFSTEASEELMALWKEFEAVAREKYGLNDKGEILTKALHLAIEASR